MKSQEKMNVKKEILLVSALFTMCGFALYQFTHINDLKGGIKNPGKGNSKTISFNSGIKQPLEKTIDFTEFDFDVAEGINAHLKTGTNVLVPKNALIDSKGNPVKGKVTLKIREMHSAKDIFLSGIPMQTDENRNLFLESNGMMEMRVFKGHEELKLADDKKVEIELAAFSKPTNDYKLWVLDNERKWMSAGSYETVNNEQRDKKLIELDNEKKKRKKEKNGDNMLFVFNSNLKNFPHMAVWQDVKWNLLIEDPNFEKENIGRVDWTDIKMKKKPGNNNEYSIQLSYSNPDYEGNLITITCNIVAEPELSKQELKSKQTEFASLSEKYDEFLELARKEEERLKAEAALLNKFSANGFGIYNIDKLTNAEQLVKLDVHFDFENELLLSKNPIQLMVVSPDRNTVLNFLPSSWNNIPYLGNNTQLFASLPNGTYAIVDSKSFSSQVPKDKLSSSYQNKVTFKTKRINKDEINNFF
jgi:hypothetical protein